MTVKQSSVDRFDFSLRPYELYRLQIQEVDANGNPIDITGRTYIWSQFRKVNRASVSRLTGTGSGITAEILMPGSVSEAVYASTALGAIGNEVYREGKTGAFPMALGSVVAQPRSPMDTAGEGDNLAGRTILIQYATPVVGVAALQALSAPAMAGTGIAASIAGTTPGSVLTFSGTPPSGATLNSAARTITFASAGTFSYAITETLAGATGSPRTTALSTTVAQTVTLNNLSIPSTSTPGTVAISGATSGSMLSGSMPVGVTLDSTNRTLTISVAGSYTLAITETLSGATNSPHTTSGLTITVSVTNRILLETGDALLLEDSSYFLLEAA